MFQDLLTRFAAGSRLVVFAVGLAACSLGAPPEPTINCSAVDSALVIEAATRSAMYPNPDYLIHLPDFVGTFTSAQISELTDGAGATIDTYAPVVPSTITVSVEPLTPNSTSGTFRFTANLTDSVGTVCPVDHVFQMAVVNGSVLVSSLSAAALRSAR